MSKQVFDLKLAEAEAEALSNAADKFVESVEAIKSTGFEGGMILVNVPLNSVYAIEDELAFTTDTGVEAVTLDSITALDGTEVEFGTVGGNRFVPSFDSKENGKWIAHYFVKDADENVLLKLKAEYDHNTKLVKTEGHGFEQCSIRIDLKRKPKIEDNGIIYLTTKRNDQATHEWFTTFSDREVENVSLHRVWMSGHDGIGFDTDEHPFTPSFNSDEKGVYNTSFVHQRSGEPDIWLAAKYDHATGTVSVEGENFDNIMIRIKLKPKAE